MSITVNRFTVRAMRPDELSIAIDWAAREGWNPGLQDAVPFGLADPDGFLLGLLDGIPVAVISAVRYGADFGFIGFYIVQPEFRGRGFGWAIWQAALHHLQGRTIGLDGVVAQQENYRRSGFEFAQRNIRFEGQAKHTETQPAHRLFRIDSIAEAQLLAYDKDFFPATRAAFLKAWISRPGSFALGASTAGKLIGYAVLRPCRVGFKVGPLYADSPEVADELLFGLLKNIPEGSPFYLDIPACNVAALSLADKAKMRPVFETARMYQGAPPSLALDRTYGITSFELG